MDTYGMNADCENCGHHFTAQIPKGTKVAEYEGECPNCGVAAVSVRKDVPVAPVPQPYRPPYVPWYPGPYWHTWSSTTTTEEKLPKIGSLDGKLRAS